MIGATQTGKDWEYAWQPRLIWQMRNDGWSPQGATLIAERAEYLIRERGCRGFFREHGVTLPDEPVPQWMRKAVLERDAYTCQHCGTTHNPEIDHIIPRVKGGQNVPENLQVLCRRCNRRKGTQ